MMLIFLISFQTVVASCWDHVTLRSIAITWGVLLTVVAAFCPMNSRSFPSIRCNVIAALEGSELEGRNPDRAADVLSSANASRASAVSPKEDAPRWCFCCRFETKRRNCFHLPGRETTAREVHMQKPARFEVIWRIYATKHRRVASAETFID